MVFLQRLVIVPVLLLSACIGSAELSSRATLSGVLPGTATYRERMALPPDADLVVRLFDIGAPGTAVAEVRTKPGRQVPLSFVLPYDVSRINLDHDYALAARIEVHGQPLFITDKPVPVFAKGQNERVDFMLVRAP